ncbi:MAG: hypothetical protein J1F22_04740 [Lachnospiraceae bacterium]|nr:hypothetical protein [Lachnospiraceae bacterium]
MIALRIENIKEFMARLFAGDMFDRFHVSECEVTTFVTFHAGGKLHPEWFDTEERREQEKTDVPEIVTWQQLKPYIFSLIKGKKTPEKLRIDFCHYMENGDCGSLRIQYEKEELIVFTGYMQKEFSLDKEKKIEWDENCLKFIQKNEITSTHLE